MIDPILEKRKKEEEESLSYGDRHEYMLKNRSLIMDENE